MGGEGGGREGGREGNDLAEAGGGGVGKGGSGGEGICTIFMMVRMRGEVRGEVGECSYLPRPILLPPPLLDFRLFLPCPPALCTH